MILSSLDTERLNGVVNDRYLESKYLSAHNDWIKPGDIDQFFDTEEIYFARRNESIYKNTLLTEKKNKSNFFKWNQIINASVGQSIDQFITINDDVIIDFFDGGLTISSKY